VFGASGSGIPTDANGGGKYDDVNNNGGADFADIFRLEWAPGSDMDHLLPLQRSARP
jgi:hypothetical protein